MVPHLERGGTQNYLLGLFRTTLAFDAAIRHFVAVLGHRDAMLEEFERSGAVMQRLDIASLGRFPRLAAVRRIAAIIRAEHIHLVQTHSRFDRPYGYLAGIVTRTPVVDTLHSEFAAGRYQGARSFRDRVRDAIERRIERLAVGGLIAVSPHLIDMRSNAGATAVPQAVVPPIVNPRFFEPVSRTERQGSAVRLVSVARHVPGKRLDLIVRALQILRRDGVDAHLTLVGDGPVRTELQKLAAELGVSGYVDFTGERNDVHRILDASDVFVFPSETEGFAIAVLEAALRGLRIVTAPLPAVETLLGSTAGVVYIEAASGEAVADGIRRALSGTAPDTDRTALAQRFRPDEMLSVLERFYRSVNAPVRPATMAAARRDT